MTGSPGLPAGMALPAVTVVVPCMNCAETVGDCLESIVSQGYPNLDLRVVDGGSSDGSQKIVERFGSHLSFFCSEPDGGHYRGVEKGFRGARGEVMAWLNADDLYLPGALLTVGEIFGAFPGVEWLTTLSPMFIDRGGRFFDTWRVNGFSRDSFLEGLHVPALGTQSFFAGLQITLQQESTFWRRSLWERSGARLDPAYPLAGDFDLWARFAEVADPFGTPVPLAAFRCREGQRSQALAEYVAEANASLAALRARVGWKSIHRRRRLIFEWLGQNPWFGEPLNHARAFRGQTIKRTDPGRPDRHWRIEETRYQGP
jgi:glycosyltransferase involved in cell wall biosynthesis